jgi:hypothetical protein
MRTTVRTSRRTSVSTGGCGTLFIALFVLAVAAYAVEVIALAIGAIIVVLIAAAIIRRVRRSRH